VVDVRPADRLPACCGCWSTRTTCHRGGCSQCRPAALDRLRWPENAELIASAGWQRADASLAESYLPSADPLLLITGDGDFALLAERHPGPVLVVSGAASGRLRSGTTVVDPATEGVGPIEAWLAAHGARPAI
jgi:hypothetical protein